MNETVNTVVPQEPVELDLDLDLHDMLAALLLG